MIFTQVNPEQFIKSAEGVPAFGRGAWVRTGIGFDYRYMINPAGQPRIGTTAEKGLSQWAVAAGSWAIQSRLIQLEHLAPISDGERGMFGPKTEEAVKAFQSVSKDPERNVALVVDGTVGRSDARSLFTPVITSAESKYGIPNKFLLGETNHESRLDPGAVGYYIYYPDYRGVDRAISQINSRANAQVTWGQAFDPVFSIDWSGRRLREAYDDFKASYPSQTTAVLWDAALCNHNSPVAARAWAKTGFAPTETAAKYVSDTKAARY